MTLKDFREAYYTLSGKASDITRQLGFAGLGAIWIFKYGSAGSERVPNELVPAAVAIVLALLLDFLQYAVGSLVWGAFARYTDVRRQRTDDVGFEGAFIDYRGRERVRVHL